MLCPRNRAMFSKHASLFSTVDYQNATGLNITHM
jgi:hypothetical protein